MPSFVGDTFIVPALEPWITPSLQIYLEAIGQMFDPLVSVVENSEVDPGWGSILNPSTFPLQYNLQYLAQFVGVQLTADLTQTQDLALIAQEQGFSRGTAPSILMAVARGLNAGAQAPKIIERTNASGATDPYFFVVVVNATDIPGTISTTGTTTNASKTLTAIPSTAAMTVGEYIVGVNLPVYTTIASIVSSSSITVSNAATAGASGSTLAVVNSVSYATILNNVKLIKPAGLQWTLLPTIGVIWSLPTHTWTQTGTVTWAQAFGTTP